MLGATFIVFIRPNSVDRGEGQRSSIAGVDFCAARRRLPRPPDCPSHFAQVRQWPFLMLDSA